MISPTVCKTVMPRVTSGMASAMRARNCQIMNMKPSANIVPSTHRAQFFRPRDTSKMSVIVMPSLKMTKGQIEVGSTTTLIRPSNKEAKLSLSNHRMLGGLASVMAAVSHLMLGPATSR